MLSVMGFMINNIYNPDNSEQADDIDDDIIGIIATI